MPEVLTQAFASDGILIGYILPFLFVLTLIIFVHEMGHYLVGRWCGIGVRVFSIGFGPALISRTAKSGTKWQIAAVPLGGYVKFLGDMGPAGGRNEDEMETLTEAEQKVAFHNQALWKKTATVLAGPVANFILTIAIFTFFFAIYGRGEIEPVVAEVIEGSIAEQAGFQPGDVVISIDGNDIERFDQVQTYVNLRAGDELQFVVRRNEQNVSIAATPAVQEITDRLGQKIKVGQVGIRIAINQSTISQVKFTPLEAVGEAFVQTGTVLNTTIVFLRRLIAGREDKCKLGGPVKIAEMSGKAAQVGGIEYLIQIAALLSVSIGFLNLMPVPPLDGGHLLFYAIEAVTRRPATMRVQNAVFAAGFTLVMGLMIFVFWNDLFACR